METSQVCDADGGTHPSFPTVSAALQAITGVLRVQVAMSGPSPAVPSAPFQWRRDEREVRVALATFDRMTVNPPTATRTTVHR